MSGARRPSLIQLAVIVALAGALGVALWWRPPSPKTARERDAAPPDDPPRELEASSDDALEWRRAWGPSGEGPGEGELGVAGRILDPVDGPLGEGRVELRCRDGRRLATLRVTEEGGFSGPACPGTTCVRLVHPGAAQPGPWQLEPGELAELEVEAAPTLRGVVVNPKLEPVAGAQLLVFAGEGARSTTTDVDGAFAASFPGRRPCDRCDQAEREPSCREQGRARGPRPAGAVAPSGRASRRPPVELTPGASVEHELQLSEARAPITGVLLDREGQPFGTRAKILAASELREDERHAVHVDARGRFELTGLGDGDYVLRAIRDSLEIARVVGVPAGERVELRADVARSGAMLRVELVDREGEPVAGARVFGGPFRGQLTDAEGRAEVRGVLEGDYELRVRVGSCAPRRHRVAVEGGETVVERRLAGPADCEDTP